MKKLVKGCIIILEELQRKFSKELIIKSIENSILLSLFEDNIQIGFARIVGDGATFAWLCDVFVSENYRGKCLGKFLMKCAMEHPSTNVRTNLLGTKDAHGLYEKYGLSAKKITERVLNAL